MINIKKPHLLFVSPRAVHKFEPEQGIPGIAEGGAEIKTLEDALNEATELKIKIENRLTDISNWYTGEENIEKSVKIEYDKCKTSLAQVEDYINTLRVKYSDYRDLERLRKNDLKFNGVKKDGETDEMEANEPPPPIEDKEAKIRQETIAKIDDIFAEFYKAHKPVEKKEISAGGKTALVFDDQRRLKKEYFYDDTDKVKVPVSVTAEDKSPDAPADKLKGVRTQEALFKNWDIIVGKLLEKKNTGKEQSLNEDQRWALMLIEKGKSVTRVIDGKKYVLGKDATGSYLRVLENGNDAKPETAADINMSDYLATARAEMLIPGRTERTPAWTPSAKSADIVDVMEKKKNEFDRQLSWFIAPNTQPGSRIVFTRGDKTTLEVIRQADGKVRTIETNPRYADIKGKDGKNIRIATSLDDQDDQPVTKTWTPDKFATFLEVAHNYLFEDTQISKVPAKNEQIAEEKALVREQMLAEEKSIEEKRLAEFGKIAMGLAERLSIVARPAKPFRNEFKNNKEYEQALAEYEKSFVGYEDKIAEYKVKAFKYLRENPIKGTHEFLNDHFKVSITLEQADDGNYQLIAQGKLISRSELEGNNMEEGVGIPSGDNTFVRTFTENEEDKQA